MKLSLALVVAALVALGAVDVSDAPSGRTRIRPGVTWVCSQVTARKHGRVAELVKARAGRREQSALPSARFAEQEAALAARAAVEEPYKPCGNCVYVRRVAQPVPRAAAAPGSPPARRR